MKSRRKTKPAEDFQMAPMIDMVFLLLVFFMCVSTLSQAEKQIELELPESEESNVPEDLSNRGTISIDPDGGIFLGSKELTEKELKRHLREALKNEPSLRVQVRADRETDFQHIKKVLKSCAEAGAHEVIYATYESG